MSTDRLLLDEVFEAELESELAGFSAAAESNAINQSFGGLKSLVPGAVDRNDMTASEGADPVEMIPESIVMIYKRPSIIIRHGDFETPQSPTWAGLLEASRPALTQILPAVGRIEVDNHPRLHAVGSAFLLPGGIVVTNRHVATDFVEKHGGRFRFATSPRGRQISAYIDFKEEDTSPVEEDEHALTDILYVANADEPDLAFLHCPSAEGRPAFTLSDDLARDEAVAAIGYPFEDGRLRPDLREAADRIFEDVYEVKRLAPGKAKEVDALTVLHDCTTLHGNSGSVLVKLATGEAVGVHHGGGITANYAVASGEVMRTLERVTG